MLDNRNNKTGMMAPEKKQADNISAKSIYSTFAFNLREKRKKQGLSQEGLADICGVSVHTIKRYETGTTKQGSLDAAYKIAVGLEKSLDEMLVSPFDKKPIDILENPEVQSVLSELIRVVNKK